MLPNCAFLNNVFESMLTSVYKYLNILKPESDSFAKYISFLPKMCFWSAFRHVDRTLNLRENKVSKQKVENHFERRNCNMTCSLMPMRKTFRFCINTMASQIELWLEELITYQTFHILIFKFDIYSVCDQVIPAFQNSGPQNIMVKCRILWSDLQYTDIFV